MTVQTGETMGGVDLTTNLPMGGTANATQMQMQMRKAHAVPQQAGAGTVGLTVEMEAPTSVSLIPEMIMIMIMMTGTWTTRIHGQRRSQTVTDQRSKTGETMGGADLNTNLTMGGTANVTQMQMQMRKVHAVPKQAGAGTVVFTVEMEAPTSVLMHVIQLPNSNA